MLLPQDQPKTRIKPCCGEGRVEQPSVMSVTVPSSAIVRRSCLECVEKHIGAAWVLYSEYKNGYPYRVLIVGHLHEAEEESREYPELHENIRRERKNFQRGLVPDFEGLANLLKKVSVSEEAVN